MTLAIVYAGEKIESGTLVLLPMTSATASVSPIARASPRIAAPRMPDRAYGSTAIRIISQRVAPSARMP